MTKDEQVGVAMLRNELARVNAELAALKQSGAVPQNPSRIEAPDGWWVRAEEYDKLAKAARELRQICKTCLPVVFYAVVEQECAAVDAALKP